MTKRSKTLSVSTLRRIISSHQDEIPEVKYLLLLIDDLQGKYGRELTISQVSNSLKALESLAGTTASVISFHLNESVRINREPHGF